MNICWRTWPQEGIGIEKERGEEKLGKEIENRLAKQGNR